LLHDSEASVQRKLLQLAEASGWGKLQSNASSGSANNLLNEWFLRFQE